MMTLRTPRALLHNSTSGLRITRAWRTAGDIKHAASTYGLREFDG